MPSREHAGFKPDPRPRAAGTEQTQWVTAAMGHVPELGVLFLPGIAGSADSKDLMKPVSLLLAASQHRRGRVSWLGSSRKSAQVSPRGL